MFPGLFQRIREAHHNIAVAIPTDFRQCFCMSKKELILDAIRQLPEDADYATAIEEIRIAQRIEEGERAADEGRVRRQEELRKLIRSWSP